MTDLIFHKAERYIEEDLEYYFSGERDIHNQVKPRQDIYSFTPDSPHLNIDFNDKKIGNLFFPFAPGSLDRIYIGISFPLFANNWGAAFLRHLMTLVKPEGCVVLPVYPEMQASEKNYWARSILEDTFISRSRWKGMSNIWAENDGVMSMRIGRKQPPEVHSTANYLLRQSGQTITRHEFLNTTDQKTPHEQFISLHKAHWENVTNSAIVETIIQEHFGRKQAIKLAVLGKDKNNSLLAIESLLSPYINVEKAFIETSTGSTEMLQPDDLVAFHSHQIKDKLTISANQGELLASAPPIHVITLINNLDKDLIEASWPLLSTGGLLIVHQNKDLSTPRLESVQIESLLNALGTTQYYSSIAASKHLVDIEISHYSLMIEQELRDENINKDGVFWVVQK
jgi:hypothetical protein